MKNKYFLSKIVLLLLLVTTSFYAQQTATSNIFVDASKTDNTGNGFSWATAKKDIQSAIDIASTGNQIWIKAGVYYPTSHPNMTASSTVTNTSPLSNRDNYILLKDGVNIFGGFAGTETALSQRDIATNVTYIDGDLGMPNDISDNCYHLMIYLGTYSSTGITLDGLIFRNANAQRDAASTDPFESTIITANGNDNYIQRRLAGVYIQQGLNSYFNNLVFENNTAENRGAGLYTYGGYGITCSYTVTNSYFVNNLLTQSTYGAWAADYGIVKSYNNVFYGNKVGLYQYGNGVALFLNLTKNDISNCSFVKNESFNGATIGIIADANQPTRFSNLIFYGTTRNPSFVDTKGYDFGVNYLSNYSVTAINCNFEHAATTYSTANDNNIDTTTSSNNIFELNPLFSDILSIKGPDNKYFTSDDGLALLATSPCKNTGNNSEIPFTITTDITGANRILSTTVDMGAYETDGVLNSEDFDLNTNMLVYPNPVSSNLNVIIDTAAKIELYDITGKTLLIKNIEAGETNLNMNSITQGIYLIKITNALNQTKTFKVIKK